MSDCRELPEKPMEQVVVRHLVENNISKMLEGDCSVKVRLFKRVVVKVLWKQVKYA